MDPTPRNDDDATLVQRIAEGRDQSALAELMAKHGPWVTGDLQRRFRHQLQHPEIDEAVNRAAINLWNNAHRFNRTKPFGPWFLTIAVRAAMDILKGEKRRPTCELEFDPPDLDTDCGDEPELSPRVAWYVEQLEQIIDYELTGFEQALAREDLAAGGRADTERLMKKYKKSKGVVQSTRSKVWKKIRETILEREALLDRTKGNK
jgi:DNA-directed RNA polymerase specialized sigma24 family protein